jgi:hypothetical protein
VEVPVRRSFIVLLSAAACGRVDPAPEDLDGLIHFFWDSYADGENDDLARAIPNLHAAIPATLPLEGAQSRLVASQLASIEVAGSPDPQQANGFFIVTELACDLDRLEAINIALNQDEQFPGTYDAYERSYTSDVDAYLARETDRLTWDVTIQASPAGFDYLERISGGVRRISAERRGDLLGDALVFRTWLREPAEESDDNRSFEQDYQLDIYHEPEPRRLIHTYAIWRKIDMGSLGDQDSAALIAVTLNGAKNWDQDTEKLCAEAD